MKRLSLVLIFVLCLLLLVSCSKEIPTEPVVPSNETTETVSNTNIEPIETTANKESDTTNAPVTTKESTTVTETVFDTSVETEEPLTTSAPETQTTATEITTRPEETTTKKLEIVDLSGLPTTKSEVCYQDFNKNIAPIDQTIGVLVTVVEFTDGLYVDRADLEDKFIKEYDISEAINSVSSFYKYSLYDQVKFNFKFVYYDSGLTSHEAYYYVNHEDEDGHFLGNQYFFNIFTIMKNRNEAKIDYKELDGDNDGYIDISIFIFAEDQTKTNPGEGNYAIFGSASGSASNVFQPDLDSPNLNRYIKTSYSGLVKSPKLGNTFGPRTIIHEIGHALGLRDYYDFHAYEEKNISPLGGFDMMDSDKGDHNSFSKFALGVLEPYVVQDVEDEITISICCNPYKGEAILIPTSKGWNGTAFDEYILIDVLAPTGLYLYDWKDNIRPQTGYKNSNGGVRILHVDARLMAYKDYKYIKITPQEAVLLKNDPNVQTIAPEFYNSNSVDPYFEDGSRFYHFIEVVPSDNSSKYRVSTPQPGVTDIYWIFTPVDLFGEGDVFILDENNEAFANRPYMNNGGTLDYSITVEKYNPTTYEAVITIKKISN